MRALLETLSGCELDVPEMDGAHRFVRLRPPSVREAAAVIVALEDMRTGEEDAWDRLSEACGGWLPGEIHDRYFGPDAYPIATLQDINSLLKAGVQNEAHETDRKEVEEEARLRSWMSVIADYAAAFHMTPRAALEEPWPFFISMCAEVFRLKAQVRADFMLGYAAAKSADEKLWTDNLIAAGYAPPKSTARWVSPGPEWEEENRRKIENYRAKHFPKMKKGEA